MADVLVAGETLVDLVPDGPGTLDDVDGFVHRPGGAPANVAVGLARLGRSPAFWTRLPTDPFGEYLAATLSGAGVSTEHATRVEGAKTTLAVVTPRADGDAEFAFYGDPEGTFGFDPEAVPRDALAAASWVHVGGVALTHPDGRRGTLELAEAAADRGCPLSVDPNVRPDLIGDEAAFRAALETLFELTDVLVCSAEDLAWLSVPGGTAGELAAAALEYGPETAFVTAGAEGAAVRSRESGPWGGAGASHPGFDVAAADATGAGDAFTAAVVHQFCDGAPAGADAVLRFANAAAAQAVQRVGGMAGLPTADAVEEFLADRG